MSLVENESLTLISMKNGSIIIGFGPSTTFPSLELSNPDQPAFYVPDFFLTHASPWIQHNNWLVLSIDEFEKQLPPISTPDPIEWTIGHQDLFKHFFSDLKSKLDVGHLKKGVPYTFTYTPHRMTLCRLNQSLRTALHYIKHYPGYLYGHWNGSQGFLGVTPEILFSHDHTHLTKIHTMALAGTKKTEESNRSLENNEKEQSEHRLVIQGIAETFEPLGKVDIGSTTVLDLPTLKHLLTPLEITLKQPFHFKSVVEAMHPTAALGAFPKEQGWTWLKEYQTQLDRQNFGAPFGIHFPTKAFSFCLVAIRQVQWSEQGMRIGAGCGVVKESSLDKEWEEIQLKIKAIRTFLSL